MGAGVAGNTRNERQLREGKPDICVAFIGGSGTEDMTGRAARVLGSERVFRVDGKGNMVGFGAK